MKFSQIFGAVLMSLLLGCNGTSRSEYAMPEKLTKTPEEQSALNLKFLTSEIRTHPNEPLNYLNRAQLNYEAGNYTDALNDILPAERLSPNSGEILYLKSLVLYKMGDKSAQEVANIAEDLGYESPALFTLMANLYLDKKDLKKGQQYLQKAARLYPYDADIYEGRGRYFALNKDTATAVLNYKRAISLQPDAFEYYDKLIKIYSHSRQIDSAMIINSLAQRKFPKRTELIYNKGLILENLGLEDSALVVYKRFLRAEPKQIEVYNRIGDLYLSKKNYSSAFISYNNWAKLDPENTTPKLKAARTYMAQENFAAAKYYLNKALEQLPNNKALQRELKNLDYKIDQAERLRNWTFANKKTGNISETEEDKRIFDNNLDIHKLPKKTTLKTDSTGN